jgi:hypothetical protein
LLSLVEVLVELEEVEVEVPVVSGQTAPAKTLAAALLLKQRYKLLWTLLI